MAHILKGDRPLEQKMMEGPYWEVRSVPMEELLAH